MSEYCLIELTKGYTAIVDGQDSDLKTLKWMAVADSDSPVYAARATRVDRKQVKTSMHTVILERILGRALIRGEMCDHKDGSGLNNTRDNLRLASSIENARNRKVRSDSETGIRGVNFHKQTGKWRPYIFIEGKIKSLGLFDDLSAAVLIRKQAEEFYFKEFSPALSRVSSRIVVYDNDPDRSLKALKEVLSTSDLVELKNLINEL